MAETRFLKFHRTHSPWHAGKVYPVQQDGVPLIQARELVRLGAAEWYSSPQTSVIEAASTTVLEQAEKRGE